MNQLKTRIYRQENRDNTTRLEAVIGSLPALSDASCTVPLTLTLQCSSRKRIKRHSLEPLLTFDEGMRQIKIIACKKYDNCRIWTCAGNPKWFRVTRLNHSAKLSFVVVFLAHPLIKSEEVRSLKTWLIRRKVTYNENRHLGDDRRTAVY